jgi:transcriptional regulator with XRE-family HTH domain
VVSKFRINEIIEEKNLSIKVILERSGLWYPDLYRLRENKRLNVTVKTLERLAEALEVPVWYLFDDAPKFEGAPDTRI